jgi:hypothetical protein
MRREGESCEVSAIEYSCAHHVTWSPNKLWRSTSYAQGYPFAKLRRLRGQTESSSLKLCAIRGETQHKRTILDRTNIRRPLHCLLSLHSYSMAVCCSTEAPCPSWCGRRMVVFSRTRPTSSWILPTAGPPCISRQATTTEGTLLHQCYILC